MLTAPIPPILTDNPESKYNAIAGTLAPGEMAIIPCDYSIKELPSIVGGKALEEIYLTADVLPTDGNIDSYDIRQGDLSICGSVAQAAGYAAIPQDLPIAIENGVYPLTKSPIGLYFVRVVNPADKAKTVWVAVDSKYPVSDKGEATFCKQSNPGAGFIAQLVLKAKVAMMGGGFDCITNSDILKIPFAGHFPYTDVYTADFDVFKSTFDKGAIVTITFAQQYDAAGTKITPIGFVYAHAYAIVDHIDCTDADGVRHRLVRVQNPWNSGKDVVSAYSENTSAFWAAHPEYEQKRNQALVSTGNFWMGWDELISVTSKSRVHLRAWTGRL